MEKRRKKKKIRGEERPKGGPGEETRGASKQLFVI